LAKNNGLSINILWSKIKTKYDDFDISQGHLARVIRDNNITRKRTTRRHYPETRYGKAIDLKKELKYFYSIVDKYSLNKIISKFFQCTKIISIYKCIFITPLNI